MFCCELIEPDDVGEDGAHFDCETCPMAEAVASLRPENAEAWQAYRQIATRVNMDFGLAPAVFDRLCASLDADDVLELSDRLGIIHDILNPPPKREPDGA